MGRSNKPKKPKKPKRTTSKGRRDFAKWGFLVALLAWLFPDPLSRLFSPAPLQKVVSVHVQESVQVRESITLTPKPATLTLGVNSPNVVVATATQTNANVGGF